MEERAAAHEGPSLVGSGRCVELAAWPCAMAAPLRPAPPPAGSARRRGRGCAARGEPGRGRARGAGLRAAPACPPRGATRPGPSADHQINSADAGCILLFFIVCQPVQQPVSGRSRRAIRLTLTCDLHGRAGRGLTWRRRGNVSRAPIGRRG